MLSDIQIQYTAFSGLLYRVKSKKGGFCLDGFRPHWYHKGKN